MKENYTQLYPNEQVATAVGDYAYEHSTPLPAYITEYHAEGSKHEKSNYMISPLQAQFQFWMAKAVGAKRSMSIALLRSLPSFNIIFPLASFGHDNFSCFYQTPFQPCSQVKSQKVLLWLQIPFLLRLLSRDMSFT